MFPIAELYPVFTEHYADIPEVQQGIVRIAWNYCVGGKFTKSNRARTIPGGSADSARSPSAMAFNTEFNEAGNYQQN